MPSLAQEESRSISENCTWGQRKKFADGKVCVPYSRFLGYDRGENGGLVVDRDKAETVRLIHSMFLDGKCVHRIADELTALGIKTPGGKDRWNQRTVRAILTNEKYIGDALLQKSFTVDYLTKKKKMNEGDTAVLCQGQSRADNTKGRVRARPGEAEGLEGKAHSQRTPLLR